MNSSDKYNCVFEPVVTQALLRGLCRNKKTPKATKKNALEMEKLHEQYECYRREAKGKFKQHEIERAFGVMVSNACNTAFDGLPYANTEKAFDSFRKIEDASGRGRGLINVNTEHTVPDVIKLNDVLKAKRSVCPDKQPYKKDIERANMIADMYVKQSVEKIERKLKEKIQKAELSLHKLVDNLRYKTVNVCLPKGKVSKKTKGTIEVTPF